MSYCTNIRCWATLPCATHAHDAPPSSMRAAVYNEYSQDVTNFPTTQVIEIPVPAVGRDEVLVRVIRAASNPIDVKFLSGNMEPLWGRYLPMTVGYDFSGEIVAVGDDVKNFSVGEPVCGVNWGQSTHLPQGHKPGGSFAHYLTVAAAFVSRKPGNVSHDVAAAVQLVGTTAYEGLYTHLRVGAGTKLLILGGAGAVGFIAIQLAKQLGCEVWTTCSGRSIDFVKQAKPDHIIDYTSSQWWEAGVVFDAIFDTMGEDGAFAHGKQCIRPDGAFNSVAGVEAGFDPKAHAPLRAYLFCFSQNTKMQDELLRLLATGRLNMPLDSSFPFTTEGVRDLLRKQGEGKSKGKNVLLVD